MWQNNSLRGHKLQSHDVNTFTCSQNKSLRGHELQSHDVNAFTCSQNNSLRGHTLQSHEHHVTVIYVPVNYCSANK
jgi:hypothetical protein